MLSILAARAGAGHVYCVEMSQALCEVAKECIQANGCEEKVSLVHAHSSDLQPHHMSHGPPQVLVTELVDSGLFGEHIVSVLSDARRLLAKEAIVIPHSASLWAQLIQSDDIQHRKEYRDAHKQLVATAEEVYTCDNLLNLDHTPLSAPFLVAEVVFEEVGARSGPLIFSHNCHVTVSGRVDAVVTWFDLHLTDPRDPDPISISTEPGRPSCGWDQAIHFVHGMQVELGSDIECRFLLENEVLSVALSAQPLDLSQIRLGEMDIAALNDTQWWREFENAAITAHSAFPESVVIESTSRWRSVIMSGAIPCEGVCLTSTEPCSQILTNIAVDSHSRITISHSSILEHCAQRQDLSSRSFILICDIIEGSGLIRQRVLQDIAYSLLFLQNVGRIIPFAFEVHVSLFESEETCSRYVVSGANTAGVNLQSINSYMSSRICELELGSSAFRQLSDVAKVRIELSELKNANDVVLEQIVTLRVDNPGAVHLIGFWFSLELNNCHSLSLWAKEDPAAHCRQAGFMVEGFHVNAADELEVVVTVSLSYGVHCMIKR